MNEQQSAQSEKHEAAPATFPHQPLNARFRDRIPSIVEQIAMAGYRVDQPLNEAKVALEEFRDYLSFEIAKIDLKIKRDEWESRVDPAQLEIDKAWLSELQKLKEEFTPDQIMSSRKTMSDLTDKITKVLCGRD